ncbi:MAG TPA: ABC transporter permease [Candidatus Limnocylindrales bacterium]|nr:ABC transporter permease [Candidatus Limnocylindrales bacterium]
MSASRILAVARRIAQGFRRDERTLGLVFVVPIAITLLLGWVIRDSEAGEVRIAVVSAEPFRLADALSVAADGADVPFEVSIIEAADEGAARDQVRDGTADVAVIATELPDGPVTVVTEGTDPSGDAARIGALRALMARAIAMLIPPELSVAVPAFEHETVFLSPDADSMDVLAPVFLGYFAYFFVFILTGISFLRERVGGTLERLLATPVTRGEIVLGYGIGFGIFATLQVLLLIGFTLLALEVPAIGPIPAFTVGLGVTSVGSPALLFLLAVLLALGAVNLGIFLSTFARTELQVIQFIPVVIVPQGLLGGIFWPIDQLPDILRPVAQVLPVTYAVDGLREVMLRGADLSSATLQLDLAVLAGIALFFVALASRTIKREVA